MKKISSKRAKACAIPTNVKIKVAERDEIDGWTCCVLCGSNQALPEAHYISRANGGLGIEENILSLCRKCHYLFDNGDAETRALLKAQAKAYLQKCYPEWNEERLIYGTKTK